MNRASFLVLLHVAPAAGDEPLVPAPAAERESAGVQHLQTLAAEPWGVPWRGATLTGIRRVEQKPGQPWAAGFGPVWWGKVTTPGGENGYLLWQADGAGELLEFALDSRTPLAGEGLRVITGVPAQQQFAVTQEDGSRIASGCVPTAGGSVLGFWVQHGQPGWLGTTSGAPVADLTRRLRARLTMSAFPDTSGYTEDALTLAGAQPADLARVLEADAAAHGIRAAITFQKYRYQRLQEEINAGRPVLLSCMVRLPHKPELSWGHEVAGVGWAETGGRKFAGVSDNFYPVQHPETVRWITTSAFQSLISIVPADG